MQATPAKGKAAKAAAEAEDPETTAALQKVASAIVNLPKEPGSFSLMEKQEGGGYVQGGDSVPPPRHGSKVTSQSRTHPNLTHAEISRSSAPLQCNSCDGVSCQWQSCIQLLVEQCSQASGAVICRAMKFSCQVYNRTYHSA